MERHPRPTSRRRRPRRNRACGSALPRAAGTSASPVGISPRRILRFVEFYCVSGSVNVGVSLAPKLARGSDMASDPKFLEERMRSEKTV